MKKWKKWKIKFKIYSKITLSNSYQYKIKEETKYRFCLYFIFYNFYKNYITKILLYNFFKLNLKIIKNKYLFRWKNIIILINKINKYLFYSINPKNKNYYKKKIILEELIPEIFILIFLKKWQVINFNPNFFNFNFIYSINTIFELILWIHLVKIDIFLINKNDSYFYLWTLIYKHQQNCLNINFFYDTYLFKQSLIQIFYYLKIIITNYIF